MTNQIEEARSMYMTGRVITPSERDAYEAVAMAENVLGLPPANERINLDIVPMESLETTLGGANYEHNYMLLTNPTHQAPILHEATHLVMGRRGLIFPESPMSFSPFSKSVSETFAEGIAAAIYGYRSPDYLLEHANFLVSEGFDERRVSTIKKDSVRLISRQLALENAYLNDSPRVDELAERLVRDFESYVERNKDDVVKIRSMIGEWTGTIGVFNAARIIKKNIFVRGLAKKLKEGIAANKFPEEFYLEECVRALN